LDVLQAAWRLVRKPKTAPGVDGVTIIDIENSEQGVISPLLANLSLHWFEVLFYRDDGTARWAKAELVRYADDCAPGNVHLR
jgi:hypothetical protein